MTTEKKQEIINRLFAEQCSCIICNNHEIRLFHERGVKDIYRLLKEEPKTLSTVLEPAGVRWRVVVKIWKLRKIVSQR